MERCLKAFGCSNTFGAELKSPKKDAWPFVLGKLLDLPVENYGKPGASNEEIIELSIKNSLSNCSSVIVILKTEESVLSVKSLVIPTIIATLFSSVDISTIIVSFGYSFFCSSINNFNALLGYLLANK